MGNTNLLNSHELRFSEPRKTFQSLSFLTADSGPPQINRPDATFTVPGTFARFRCILTIEEWNHEHTQHCSRVSLLRVLTIHIICSADPESPPTETGSTGEAVTRHTQAGEATLFPIMKAQEPQLQA